MGHNYSKHFFNPENKHNRPFVENVEEHVENEETSFLENEEVVENVEQTEEITNIVNYAKGVVSGCDRLNVRADSSKESNVLSILECKCGYSLVVESHASDLVTRVQFSLPAPKKAF